MQQEMTAAFIELFSGNLGAGGDRDYYGVLLDGMTPDGSDFNLTLTFKAGRRYCCAEIGCHLAYSDVHWWRELRELMRKVGLAQTPPMTIRRLRVVVESGARLACRTDFGRGKLHSDVVEGYSFEVGPLAENEASDWEVGAHPPATGIE